MDPLICLALGAIVGSLASGFLVWLTSSLTKRESPDADYAKLLRNLVGRGILPSHVWEQLSRELRPKSQISNKPMITGYQTDEELTNLFCTHCPSQIPDHFEIQPLPNKIVSWLTALLLRLQEKPQLREKHTRTKLGRGSIGSPTAAGLDWKTHSWTTSHAIQESSYLELLPWLCGKLNFQDHLMSNWLRDLLQVPSHMYLRPSTSTADPAQPWTTTARLDSFYNGN